RRALRGPGERAARRARGDRALLLGLLHGDRGDARAPGLAVSGDMRVEWRRAAPVRQRDQVMLGALVILGLHATIYFLGWWFRREHVASLPLFVLLSLAMIYGISRVLVGWYNVLGLRQPAHRE